MAIDNPFDLSGLGLSANNLPPELGAEILGNLDQILQRSEGMQANRLLDQQEERGLFRSGGTETRLRDEILTPGMETRRAALLDLVRMGTGQGREERLQGVQFGRQKELQKLEFDQRMKEIERQFQFQREMFNISQDARRDAENNAPGFGTALGMGFASNFGSTLGANFGSQLMPSYSDSTKRMAAGGFGGFGG